MSTRKNGTEMGDRTQPKGQETSADDEVMEHLLQRAGRRPAVPDDLMAEARDAARDQWRWTVRSERRRRRAGWLAGGALAAAAALFLAVETGQLSRFSHQQESPGPIARLEHRSGSLLSLAGEVELRPGDELTPGSRIETRTVSDQPGRAALRLGSGVSLRLDVGTRLQLLSATEIHLESGAIYLDSDQAATQKNLVTITTDFGTVTDIGTRFEVRLGAGQPGPHHGMLQDAELRDAELQDAELRVRVRDGRVEIQTGETKQQLGADAEVTVRPDGTFDRRTIPSYDDAWAWTHQILPAFEIEGVSLHDFLSWAAHEGGWQLHYGEARLQEQAEDLVLHGSIEGLDLSGALELTLLGSGLDLISRPADGQLVISTAEAR